jgi:hypothetical protein
MLTSITGDCSRSSTLTKSKHAALLHRSSPFALPGLTDPGPRIANNASLPQRFCISFQNLNTHDTHSTDPSQIPSHQPFRSARKQWSSRPLHFAKYRDSGITKLLVTRIVIPLQRNLSHLVSGLVNRVLQPPAAFGDWKARVGYGTRCGEDEP